MDVAFACPACGGTCSADVLLSGTEARCRHCKASIIIPRAGEAADEVYAVEGMVEADPDPVMVYPEPVSTFVPSRGDDEPTYVPARRPRRPTNRTRSRTEERRDSALASWATLGWGAVVVVLALLVVALVVPNGLTIVAWVLMSVGSLMVLLGFGAGAFGAFREDFLYGFFYLVLPLYTAYYLATRWEDLWPWFACSTSGVGLVLFGTQMLVWSGAAS